MKEILKDLGLTDSEINIYLILLDNGESAVSLLSEKSQIHRRNVYDCLNRLIKKGMVGEIKKNNVKQYSVTNPKFILEKLKEKERNYEKILPQLMKQYKNNSKEGETLFFTGKEGLKQIFEDQILIGKEVLINATNSNVEEILKYFFSQYDRKRKEKNITLKMIFGEKKTSKHEEIPLCKIKYLKDYNNSIMSQYIYGDNVAIIVWSKTPISILIRQKEIAQGFRNSFETMWKLAKE